jgi:hypothetical protein
MYRHNYSVGNSVGFRRISGSDSQWIARVPLDLWFEIPNFKES